MDFLEKARLERQSLENDLVISQSYKRLAKMYSAKVDAQQFPNALDLGSSYDMASLIQDNIEDGQVQYERQKAAAIAGLTQLLGANYATDYVSQLAEVDARARNTDVKLIPTLAAQMKKVKMELSSRFVQKGATPEAIYNFLTAFLWQEVKSAGQIANSRLRDVKGKALPLNSTNIETNYRPPVNTMFNLYVPNAPVAVPAMQGAPRIVPRIDRNGRPLQQNFGEGYRAPIVDGTDPQMEDTYDDTTDRDLADGAMLATRAAVQPPIPDRAPQEAPMSAILTDVEQSQLRRVDPEVRTLLESVIARVAAATPATQPPAPRPPAPQPPVSPLAPSVPATSAVDTRMDVEDLPVAREVAIPLEAHPLGVHSDKMTRDELKLRIKQVVEVQHGRKANDVYKEFLPYNPVKQNVSNIFSSAVQPVLMNFYQWLSVTEPYRRSFPEEPKSKSADAQTLITIWASMDNSKKRPPTATPLSAEPPSKVRDTKATPQPFNMTVALEDEDQPIATGRGLARKVKKKPAPKKPTKPAPQKRKYVIRGRGPSPESPITSVGNSGKLAGKAYYVDSDALNRGTLSVRYYSSRNYKIHPVKVSDAEKSMIADYLIHGRFNKHLHGRLSDTEKRRFAQFMHTLGVTQIEGVDLLETQRDLYDQLDVLRGQLAAGNNSTRIVPMIRKVVAELYSLGYVSKMQANSLLIESGVPV